MYNLQEEKDLVKNVLEVCSKPPVHCCVSAEHRQGSIYHSGFLNLGALIIVKAVHQHQLHMSVHLEGSNGNGTIDSYGENEMGR